MLAATTPNASRMLALSNDELADELASSPPYTRDEPDKPIISISNAAYLLPCRPPS